MRFVCGQWPLIGGIGDPFEARDSYAMEISRRGA
jgi:hypothetical protein